MLSRKVCGGLFGFLPLNKPKGICINRLLTALIDDAYYTLDKKKASHGTVMISYSRHLDKFANGLVTFIIGGSNVQRRNFLFTDYKYRLVLELGVERAYGSVEGQIVSTESVDHVNVYMLEDAAKQFIGTTLQQQRNFKHPPIRLKDRNELLTTEDFYDQIQVPFEKPEESKESQQKYPMVKSKREVFCSDIKFLEFNKPFVTLEIICQGRFSVRHFIEDFLELLKIKGSILELTRTQEAIACLDDLRIFSLHEASMDYYLPRLKVWRNAYERALSREDDNFTTQKFLRHI